VFVCYGKKGFWGLLVTFVYTLSVSIINPARSSIYRAAIGKGGENRQKVECPCLGMSKSMVVVKYFLVFGFFFEGCEEKIRMFRYDETHRDQPNCSF
jgi:hypothetical protein